LSSPPLFPLFLKLAGRSCLVAGAGCVAEQKIQSLLACGACVTVVAPEANAAIWGLIDQGKVVWRKKTFAAEDLNGIFLSVAATSSPEVNHAVYQESSDRGILCNVVDDPPFCDFFYPAIVRRGHFQIAISTGGHSPALAQRIRKELEQQFPPIYGDWLENLGRERATLFSEVPDPELRRTLIHKSADAESFIHFAESRTATERKDSL
jgi:precorrin-2 dehydrogenase / sirohydrochlorin ferrochelatase